MSPCDVVILVLAVRRGLSGGACRSWCVASLRGVVMGRP
jgi:hypothetical protein